MAKKQPSNNIISIDLSKWLTQSQYAKLVGIRLNTISQRIKRDKEGQGTANFNYWTIPELGITLIERP
jgi:hypothetical protein